MEAISVSQIREKRVLADVAALRGRILGLLLTVSISLVWLWYSYALIISWRFGLATLAATLLSLACWGIHTYREERFSLACVLLWVVLSGIYGLLLASDTTVVAIAVAILLTVSLATLMNVYSTLALLAGTWLWGVISLHALGSSASPWMASLSQLLLLAASWSASQLATQPLRTALDWAFSGWEQAHSALYETRARRAELYRALRALEEANFRIERMNHDLSVSRHEAELARAQKAMFARTVSHELRGPLSIVLGFSRLVALMPERYGTPLPAVYAADIDAIYRNSQHLATLVDDILDLSQMEAERLPLIKEWVDLERDVCQQAAKIVQPVALGKGLDLVCDWHGALPLVLADAVRLRQAMLNILNNAIRFTESGSIHISTAMEQETAVVRIQDTGTGIPATDLEQVFEPFSQAQIGSEKKGSGLGLSISRQLLRLHGGDITAESSPGLGTSFTLTVPLPGAQSLQVESLATSRAPRRGSEGVCLVVGANVSAARLLHRYLERRRVVAIPKIDELGHSVEQMMPSVIVTSSDLAPQVGRQAQEAGFTGPVIGCALPQASLETRLANVLAYLTKPVSPEALLAVLGQVEKEGETRILIVDDEPDAVRLIEGHLQALPRPYVIRKAYDGPSALRLMRGWVPDIVLIDLLMGAVGGEETIEQMAKSSQLAQVPVVVISACDVFEEDAVIGLPLSVQTGNPLTLSQGMACLNAMLGALLGE